MKRLKRVPWGKILALIIVSMIFGIVVVPAIVAAASGYPEKYIYYIKALEYGLKGLEAYFNFVINLFKTAVTIHP